MASKQAVFIPADDEDVIDVFDTMVNDPTGSTEQQRKLRDVIDDLNDSTDSAELRVYKQSPLGGKSSMALIEVFPPDKFSTTELWEFLRRKYGPGDYRIHVRVNGKLVANKLLEIIPQIKETENVATPAGEMGQFMSRVLDQIAAMQNQIIDMQRGQQSGGFDRGEFIREMIMMKQLFGPSDSGGGGGNMISQMRDFMGLQRDLLDNFPGLPAPEKEEGFGDLLEKFTPLVEVALNSRSNESSRPQPNPQARRTNQMQFLIRAGISQLLKGAIRNADPATYASLVLDQIPSEEMAIQFLGKSDSLTQLQKMEPKIVPYLPWFIEVIEHVKAQLGMPSTVSDQYEDELTGDIETASVDENSSGQSHERNSAEASDVHITSDS